ncbi:E3 ubiquitin-protein ligase RNF168 [Pelodytes ibericus]
MPKTKKDLLPRSECVCPICQEILLEPVTLPCEHTLCRLCFQSTVEKASLCCPFCRKRVSTWARHHARAKTLVNTKLWKRIQSQYPEECQRRACGLETEDIDDEPVSMPDRLLCKPGEIRDEYEAEKSKVMAERLAQEEAERKASEEFIQKLLVQEAEEQQRQADAMQMEVVEQLKRDEELARSLSIDLNESSGSSVIVSPVASPTVNKQVSVSKSCKHLKRKGGQYRTIERFLSPKQRDDGVGNNEQLNISIHVETSIISKEEETENEMPILMPQVTLLTEKSSTSESDFDLQIHNPKGCSTFISDVESPHTLLNVKSVHEGSYSYCAKRNEDAARTLENNSVTQAGKSAVTNSRESCGTHSVSGWNDTFTNIPKQQHLKITPKRKCEKSSSFEMTESFSDYVKEKRKRKLCWESNAPIDRYSVHLMDQEDNLFDRRQQEERDRLLALQLQKELDKEMRQVSRKKGSPDEYQLRPNRGNEQADYQNTTALKQAGTKSAVSQSKSFHDRTFFAFLIRGLKRWFYRITYSCKYDAIIENGY